MQQLTLRTKFILITSAVFLIAAVAVFSFVSGVTSRIITTFALQSATSKALHDKNKILSIINREVALSLKLVDDDLIRAWVAPGQSPAVKKAALHQLESYRRFFRDKSYFIARAADASYFNADRSSPPEQPRSSQLSRDNPKDAWFFDTLQRVDTFEMYLDFDTLIHKTKVWINAVIRDNSGKKIGIGGTGIDLTEFLQEIVLTDEPGTAAILINRRGIIQAHHDKALVERNALEPDSDKRITIFQLLEQPAEAEQLKQELEILASQPSKGVAAFPIRINGRQSFAAVSYMPQIGWYTIALVDFSHVMQTTTFLPIILASLLALLAVITVIGYAINRMVLRPLNLLTGAAGEVAEGRYDRALPVLHRDEIGMLTQSFNSMAATVREHTAHLEERVLQRTRELTDANQQLEASQSRIMESLQYARILQTAILPDPQRFGRIFADWSVLYQPCDLVGGDLYWLHESDKGKVLLAVLDCTGHGVPGAFMTMTVNSVLNHIADTLCADDPGRILQEANRLLQETLRLRQDGESLVDAGLDIGLCCIDLKQQSLTFAGAGISLYHADEQQVSEIKGDRQRVGYSGSDLQFVYQNHHLALNSAVVCYMTTDGFLDEGGGPKGYGFGTARFRQLLSENHGLDLQRQFTVFAQRMDAWRGTRKQRDDITVLAFRL